MRYWRGALLSVALIAWPVVFAVGLLYFTGVPTQCDLDACGPPDPWWNDMVFFCALFGPPLFAIAYWAWWRLRRNGSPPRVARSA